MKNIQTITIVGTGLIGGSFAKSLRAKNLDIHFIGVDDNAANAQTALELGIVDEILNLENAVKKSHLIYVAVPVDATVLVVNKLLGLVNENQIIADAGSTKNELCNSIKNHPNRACFVATHPMWGTEHNGPAAAVGNAFSGRACVICHKEQSNPTAVKALEFLYQTLGMHMLYMTAQAHDVHTAYISHISHITSFALANTVLEKEKEDDAIFELASGGFESTVRLAKSNPAMWVPIFKQNKENVLDVLNEHIAQLKKFKSCLEKDNYDYLLELIQGANRIRKVLG